MMSEMKWPEPPEAEVKAFERPAPAKEHPLYDKYKAELTRIHLSGEVARPLLSDIVIRIAESFWKEQLNLSELALLCSHVCMVISKWRRMAE